MLLILFGYPGVGKSFVGKILEEDFDFFFYDGDIDFGPEIEAAIKKGKLFSDKLRDEYFHRVISNINELQSKHENVVFGQTLAKKRSQKMMIDKFPNAIFIKINAPMEILRKRLKNRKHLVPLEYAEKVFDYFEEPEFRYKVLKNDGDKEKIKIQLNKILNIS